MIPVDALDEPSETIVVELSGNSAGTVLLDAFGQGTILDNDATPAVSVAGSSASEDAVAGVLTFTVSLSAASGQPVTVGFGTRDVTASAASGLGLDDYEARAGTLLFPPGVATRTISVPVTADRIFEVNETLALDLFAPAAATLGTASATATITNDDPQPALAITGMDVVEGPSGVWRPVVFTVTLSSPALVPVTVTFTATSGTATAGTDFVPVTGPMTFAPGVTALARTVFVIGDGTPEVAEIFSGRLSNAGTVPIATASATATIANDD